MAIFASNTPVKVNSQRLRRVDARRRLNAPRSSVLVAYVRAVCIVGLIGSPSAVASYAQMELVGLITLLLLGVLGVYAFIVLILLLCKLFQRRVMIIMNILLLALWAVLWLINWKDFQALAIAINRTSNGEILLVLLLLGLLLIVLFIILAPLKQYRVHQTRLKA